uniref:Uncharacterized protein n=1 Tax=Glossina brevipalpis TaxID=37001 RepID=A0A1A9WR71_9MUSC
MGIKKLFTTIPLSEVMKHVPAEQMPQFEEFRKKCIAYQSEVNKYPDKLPRIDWSFYRANVPKNFVKSLEQFEIHYKELDFCFATRYDNLDFSKYYTEWEKVFADIKKHIETYVTESNNKIAIYQAEIRRLTEMIPYEDMTMEQYIIEREDVADLIPRNNLPLFWPFTEEEQPPGPAYSGFVPTDEEPVTEEDTQKGHPEGKDGKKKEAAKEKAAKKEEATKKDMTKAEAKKKEAAKKDASKKDSKTKDAAQKEVAKKETIEEDSTKSKSIFKGKKKKRKQQAKEEDAPKMEAKAQKEAEKSKQSIKDSKSKVKSTSQVPPGDPKSNDPAQGSLKVKKGKKAESPESKDTSKPSKPSKDLKGPSKK